MRPAHMHAVFYKHGVHDEALSVRAAVSRRRRVAAAADGLKELPLRRQQAGRLPVMNGRQHLIHLHIIRAALHGQDTLTRRREKPFRFQIFIEEAFFLIAAQPLNTGRSQDDAVITALLQSPQSRLYISPEHLYLHRRVDLLNL